MDLPSQSPGPEQAPVDHMQVLNGQVRNLFPDSSVDASVTLHIDGHPRDTLTIKQIPDQGIVEFSHLDARDFSRDPSIPRRPHVETLGKGTFDSSDMIRAFNGQGPEVDKKVHDNDQLIAEWLTKLIDSSYDQPLRLFGRALLTLRNIAQGLR